MVAAQNSGTPIAVVHAGGDVREHMEYVLPYKHPKPMISPNSKELHLRYQL